ncbi:MAG: PD-(D/E)XK nuclease family protein, partial [Firmicutes bacterium]|nr:PD-(D/E)XK nuclease family protein [Bacillota bacterium]
MKERIIFAPGAKGTELLRMLARFGTNTLGTRVLNATGLAQTALMRAGASFTELYLPPEDGPALLSSFLNTIPYFEKASFADAEKLFAALSALRLLVPGDEEAGIRAGLAGGEFPEKNKALLTAYERYMALCREGGKADRIALMRQAIREGKPFPAEFIILKEFPLQPLEQELLETVSGGCYQELPLADLLAGAAAADPTFTCGYGAVNEAEAILAEIYREGIPFDQCVIACADPVSYAQLFYDLAGQYEIPATFGSGVPIGNSNPARLLKLLRKWDTDGYHGVDALRELLTSDALDQKKLATALRGEEEAEGEEPLSRKEIEKLAVLAGQLRLSFDAEENRAHLAGCREIYRQDPATQGTYELAVRLARELERGYADFTEAYSFIRPEPVGRIDRSAVNVIGKMLRAYAAYARTEETEETEKTEADGKARAVLKAGWEGEIIPDILSRTVCSESSREGALHITGIRDAFSCLRRNLYITGLSANCFPGTPTENYLLLDSDLKAFGEAGERETSAGRIQAKKEDLRALLRLAGRAGVKTSLSYANYDLAALKEQNPSQALFEIFEERHSGGSMRSFHDSFRKRGYFQSGLTKAEAAGRKYLEGAEVSGEPVYPGTGLPENLLQRSWSPTALKTFFECPRHFYLTKVLYLPEPEEDEPFTVISPQVFGNLAHHLMEELAGARMAGQPLTEEEFLSACEEAWEEFMRMRPPL